MGLVLWLVLLPVKIICCPLGCVVQLLFNVVEYLLKAPLRGLLWASGKPLSEQVGEPPQTQPHGTSSRV